MAHLVDISFATPSDIPTLVQIGNLARKTDPVCALLFQSFSPFTSPSTLESKATAAFTSLLLTELSNPRAFIWKASLKTTGEIVGWAHVYLNDGLAEPVANPSFGSVKENVYAAIVGRMQRRHKSLFGGREHWVGKQLMVHPLHQRQGIGHALIDWGLANISHEEASPIYVDASMHGRGLYEKAGFAVVGVVAESEEVEKEEEDWEKEVGRGEKRPFYSCMVGKLPGWSGMGKGEGGGRIVPVEGRLELEREREREVEGVAS